MISRQVHAVVALAVVLLIAEVVVGLGKPPQMTRRLEKKKGIQDRFELTCAASGEPSVKYKWYKNHGDIDLTSTEIEIQDGAMILRFPNPGSSDEGSYYCLATNIHGVAKSDGSGGEDISRDI
jgi:hypothetical protein